MEPGIFQRFFVEKNENVEIGVVFCFIFFFLFFFNVFFSRKNRFTNDVLHKSHKRLNEGLEKAKSQRNEGRFDIISGRSLHPLRLDFFVKTHGILMNLLEQKRWQLAASYSSIVSGAFCGYRWQSHNIHGGDILSN